jgi:formylglycine-generating enzyme
MYSDQPPGATPDNTRVGNFIRTDGTANGYDYDNGYAVTGSRDLDSSQNYLTDVGAYTLSRSYYGTFDQGGNAMEWNEAKIASTRGMRGGSWDLGQAFVPNGSRSFLQPQLESYESGFRVATFVPEPNVTILAVGFSLLVRPWRMRTRNHEGIGLCCR